MTGIDSPEDRNRRGDAVVEEAWEKRQEIAKGVFEFDLPFAFEYREGDLVDRLLPNPGARVAVFKRHHGHEGSVYYFLRSLSEAIDLSWVVSDDLASMGVRISAMSIEEERWLWWAKHRLEVFFNPLPKS